MFCNNCGKLNPKNSKYCKYCDYKFDDFKSDNLETKQAIDKNQSTVAPASNEKSKTPKWKLYLGIFLTIVAYGLGRLLGEQAIGYTLFFLVVSWLIGYWFSKWLI